MIPLIQEKREGKTSVPINIMGKFYRHYHPCRVSSNATNYPQDPNIAEWKHNTDDCFILWVHCWVARKQPTVETAPCNLRIFFGNGDSRDLLMRLGQMAQQCQVPHQHSRDLWTKYRQKSRMARAYLKLLWQSCKCRCYESLAWRENLEIVTKY